MKTLKISIIILVLLMSVGAVCATNATSDDNIGDDNNQNILETTINDISSVDEPKTFTDLDKDISNSTDVFDMQDNYKFNNASDNGTGGVIIDKDNFVINGNNHIIDANGQSAIFAIKASNVTINNLTFINANSGRGSVFDIDSGCSLTTNNVNFINNTAMNAIIMVKGTYNSNNDKFTDSSSEKFGVIYLYMNTVLNINNAVMTTSKLLEWGFIYTEAENSTITILDSMFANITSNYSAAVKGTTKTVIRNTKFINLHSLFSAGAICVKNIEDAVIDNCEFINVTSERNAGVIMADVYIYNTTLPVVIRNSRFVNSYSEFGGAIMQLGGSLTVDNCTFINSTALFDGGAIYTSLVYVNISNSKFYGSKTLYDLGDRGTFGGAIFCDNSELRLVNCELINGSAQYGGALYLYDGDYNISNNVFSGNVKFNGDFDDIYSVFDDSIMTILENNVYSGAGSCNLNNTNYDTIMAGTGMKLVRLNNTIDVSSIPSKFDLRDWGWSTPVRDQGRTGSCWAFGSSGAIESAILRYLGIYMDISENNMLDLSLQYSPFGTIGMEEGGSLLSGVVYTLSWFGVLPSKYDSYDQVGKVSPIFATNESIHFQDVVLVLPRNNVTDNDVLKRAVLEYGALAVGYAADQQPPQLNPKTSAQYSNESESPDHCVALIGWDDNYSKDNFLITPPGDGAWIIKNSWGVDVGDNGYYYISYYDVNFATTACSIAYLMENTVEYNKNYQYDIGGSLMFAPEGNEYWNEYTALDDDLIAAVGTYFNDTNVEYSIEIYVDDYLVLEQKGVSPFAGFHTIKLDSYVPIKKGENFSVLIKSNSIPLFTNSRQYYMSMSSIAYIGGEWVDLPSVREVASIKVYTVVDDTKIINNKDISVDYDGGSYFSVKVVTADGHAVGAGEKVKFTINGKSKTVSTDANGIAKIKITDVPKKYILTTTYNGKSVKNTVTVKQVLTSSKVTVKKTAKKFTLQAKLKINGKLIKGKKITFKFNGKSYKAKTNAKGVAKVTVKKNVIKKLKKGKTYTVKVTYSKDTIKTTVKVK